ncbi:MAG: hypothetical protein H9Q65_02015 [Spiroplasma ixodetis]|nr:hypothetical protein [Spiroplasma ixodetis]MBP1528021.1 hypothetical protein [Spiroplasma ixodetis]
MDRLLETTTKTIEKTKTKKTSWFKLFRLIIIKISYSFITAFLFLFSIVISVLSISVLFFLNLSIEDFIIDLQYYIMIFYSIFLFIFILLNAIKIFGTQFEDSSFLLLLTKPYTRNVIILTQYAALFFMSLTFIFINIIALLIFGGICGIIIKVSYLTFYVLTILKFFDFCSLFAALVTVGVVTMLAFTPSQTVFLIFVIFCSLFLLGGLPYSLTKINSDIIKINFENNIQYTVSEIKEAILFKQNLEKGLIKYPNLTKAIFDFYSNLSDQELKDIKENNVINKRIDFYQKLGFIKTNPTVKTLSGKTTSWKPPEFQNKNIFMKITFNSYFKNLDELKNNVDNNQITEDLINIINDYDKKYNIDSFMDLQSGKAPSLLTYDTDINNTYIQITGPILEQPVPLSPKEIKNIFIDTYAYKFDFRNEFNKIFYNPVYFLVRTTEEYIYNQIHIYRQITNNSVTNDKNYKNYISIANSYQFINAINFIEHWNQIWTYFMDYYGDFWFEPYATSSIDFDTQKNTLFSYPDFKLTLNNKKIKTDNIDYFQNNKSVLEIYCGFSIFLFLLSYLMYNRKIVS